MKMKKIMSAALAGAMALSMTATAFAAGNGSIEEPSEIEVTGTTKVPTISITVPTSAAVTLNPYKLDVTIDSATKQDQVISAVYYIVNGSDVAIETEATVTGVAEGATFAAASVASSTDKTKQVYMAFEWAKTTDGSTAPAAWSDTTALTTSAQNIANKLTMDKTGGTSPAIAFHFTGDAIAEPETPWTTDDTVGATLAFTFAPKANTVAAGGGGTP